MPKKKTSFIIDEDLHRRFLSFVVKKHGSMRKLSEEIEQAIREYLERHESELK